MLEKINAALWSALALLLTGLGFWLTFRLGGQGRRPRERLQDFWAPVCTALAGTVGTGNIVGVAVALTLGGPGALFWMWVSALAGMGTKYAELSLGGSPMAYILRYLGDPFRPLATAFALTCALAALGTGNLVQAGSIAAAGHLPPLLLGGGLAGLYLLTVRRRGRVLSVLVPVMAAFYLAGACWGIVLHREALPGAVRAVLRGAGRPEAVLWGFRRGALSHEAGLGSGPLAHAGSRNPPRAEGLLGVFEVAFDTLLVSTATALLLLTSGTPPTGAAWPGQALAAALGGEAAETFLFGAVLLFAFSSILSWSQYGELACRWLRGDRAAYRRLFALLLLLAPLLPFRTALELGDLLTALMTLLNTAALIRIFASRQKNLAFSGQLCYHTHKQAGGVRYGGIEHQGYEF